LPCFFVETFFFLNFAQNLGVGKGGVWEGRSVLLEWGLSGNYVCDKSFVLSACTLALLFLMAFLGNIRYHLKDVIVGKIYFLLVRIKIRYMELAIVRRETTGAGNACVVVVPVTALGHCHCFHGRFAKAAKYKRHVLKL
jgi:hypothetical protein